MLACTQQIRFMDVYKPSEAEQKDPDLFARNVRKVRPIRDLILHFPS